MKKLILICLLLAIVFAQNKDRKGNWQPIKFNPQKNAQDKLAQELAIKSVLSKQENENLQFQSVISALVQPLDTVTSRRGTEYRYKLDLIFKTVDKQTKKFKVQVATSHKSELSKVEEVEEVTRPLITNPEKIKSAADKQATLPVFKLDRSKSEIPTISELTEDMANKCQNQVQRQERLDLAAFKRTQTITKEEKLQQGVETVLNLKFTREGTELNFDCTVFSSYRQKNSPVSVKKIEKLGGLSKDEEAKRIKDDVFKSGRKQAPQPVRKDKRVPGGRILADGGLSEYQFNSGNPDDREILKAIKVYMGQHLNLSNPDIRVINAKTQVVSGVQYVLDIKYIVDGQTQLAEVTVWSQPWKKFVKVVDFQKLN